MNLGVMDLGDDGRRPALRSRESWRRVGDMRPIAVSLDGVNSSDSCRQSTVAMRLVASRGDLAQYSRVVA